MDSIRPERDELERHHLKPRKRAKAKQGESSAAATPPVEAYVRLSRPAQGALILTFVLVVTLAVIGYWQYSRQLQVIDQMQVQLAEASRQLKQSNLMIAQLQGELQDTDSTLQQSGNEVARQLKFLDSEMRKLWDISNKRNKKWIQDAQNDIKQLRQGARSLKGEVQSLEKLLVSQAQSLEQVQTNTSALSVRLAALDEVMMQTSEMVNGVGSGLTKVEERLKSAESTLFGHEKTMETLTGRLKETGDRLNRMQEQLNVVDKARQQLVSRYVTLDKRVSALEKASRAKAR
ncbi:MAG: hypothetical protein D6758_11170 [Gammaproteobacteria bacterium]|nr:MAG: hypothetical protein D6758_11170 [Gammaproteobacteria bacterium]